MSRSMSTAPVLTRVHSLHTAQGVSAIIIAKRCCGNVELLFVFTVFFIHLNVDLVISASPLNWSNLILNQSTIIFVFLVHLLLFILQYLNRIPGKTYMIIAFLTVGTMGLSNTSLGYLNYPTQVIFKCCKLIPVMIGGVFIQGEHVALCINIFVTKCSGTYFTKVFSLGCAIAEGVSFVRTGLVGVG